MFEELRPRRRPASYLGDAVAAGFHIISGDVSADPDTFDLTSMNCEICNCAAGTYANRPAAVFQNYVGGTHPAVFTTVAFNIGNGDFRESTGLGSYWNIRHEGRWVYFEVARGWGSVPPFQDMLRDTNAILEMYLL